MFSYENYYSSPFPKSKLFRKIIDFEFISKDIELYSQIYSSTKKVSSFFESAVERFPSLFESGIQTFEESLDYLEKISIPNKSVCAGIIDAIPGFHCEDCSIHSNATIYCSDCFIKSKNLHKNHKVEFLYENGGMCDCGDPDSLSTFCSEHIGPLKEKEEIENYIKQAFGDKILENLKKYFDEFFFEFSKYFVLTEKCDLFMDDIFNEILESDSINELFELKADIYSLKSNFSIVFENFIYFLRLITKDNSGMFHLISNYLLKNNFGELKLENEYLTQHSCIEIKQDDIEIFFDSNEKVNHNCKCPFLRLFVSNYRGNIKLDNHEDEEFFLSFTHNLPLRKGFGIIYFFLYEQNMYNYNKMILNIREQFYLEETMELIAKKSNIFENLTKGLYNYISKIIKKTNFQNIYGVNNNLVFKICSNIYNMEVDLKYFSKPKARLSISDKIPFYKNIIDIICLCHNINEYKLIFPHPHFIEKYINNNLFELENFNIKIFGMLSYFIQWENIEKDKEIFKYFIYKIMNQEKEGIKQLKENEFSFHLPLYRSFGIFVNSFCFNNSFINKCSLLESINFFKNNFFENKEQIEAFVDIILKDIFKFFGFIFGCKNYFFNYYDGMTNFYDTYTNYTKYNIYKADITLLKYILLLTDKNLDINSYIKLSNIEEVYSFFDQSFNLGIIPNKKNNDKEEEINNNDIDIESPNIPIFNYPHLNYEFEKKEKKQDEFKIIMQLKNLLEFLICIIKDDSSHYFELISHYENSLSIKTKKELYNEIKSNKSEMEDLKNILKEKIIHFIMSEQNLVSLEILNQKVDNYLKILFEDNDIYNQILDNLTNNKLNGDTKLFYLKDEFLKNIDFNFYINNKDRTEAEKYILDFKKDNVKTYNYYFYGLSELTFEFAENLYEKLFLNKNNMELILKILEKLINDDKIMENSDKKSIRNSLLPVILNYLQIFYVINTKSFIEFKIENKDKINKILELLQNLVKNNNNHSIVDEDLEGNINQVINQINKYQLIFDALNGDLSKLKKFDYNINILDEFKEEQKLNNNIDINNINMKKVDEKKQKLENIKDKLKHLMKKKSDIFMKKIESNEDILKAIDEQIENSKKNNENEDKETMCFYCRNMIKLDSFKEPFGKSGLLINDLFYINSIKATLREEISKLKLENNKEIIKDIIDKININNYPRIISCGHYFHSSCFVECSKKNYDSRFECPLCLKKQNILIPPLLLFHDTINSLKSESFNELFGEKENTKINELNNKEEDNNLFDNEVSEYLKRLNLINPEIKDYTSFLDYVYPYYICYFNFFENVFYINGTTFHKHQQIDNIKNIILSLRFYITKNFNKSEIVKYIKETLVKLVNISSENNFIYNYDDSYMHFENIFQKIILSLLLLFDYEELKQNIKYIIFIFLPYFCFGLFLKKLIIEKQELKEKMNINEFEKYLEDNNKIILKDFTDFLKKFCFVKLISDYQNKNESIIILFYEYSLKNILSVLDLDEILKISEENNNLITDFIKNLSKTFNSNEIFYKLFSPNLNFQKISSSLLENFNKFNSNIDYKINKELLVQFSPIKFNFIQLNYEVLDFIEKLLGIKCEHCQRIPKESFLCLICGQKFCRQGLLYHLKRCTNNYNLVINTNNMNIYYEGGRFDLQKLYPAYVDKAGNGPEKRTIYTEFKSISNDFKLSSENLKTALKYYVCNDFNLH